MSILQNKVTLLLLVKGYFITSSNRIAVIDVRRIDQWKISITASQQPDALIWLYYASKLDNLLCMPALLFLYFGLKRLFKERDVKDTR